MLYPGNNQETMLNTDEELLHQMTNDNQEAFTMLYRRYWESLFVTAAKALRNKEEAADLVQDVFLSFWNRRRELNIQSSLAAYLHTSVRYKCINHIEKNIHRRDYLAVLTELAEASSFVSPEIKLQVKEIEVTINKTVSAMPHKMQEVYKLSRQQHLSHKEIADNMGISTETVKKHIQHALHLIRTHLPCNTLILASLIFFYSS